MAKLTKRIVDAADAREKDYVIWDDELPGFRPPGVRLRQAQLPDPVSFAAGRTRRYTIGLHGVWTPELSPARKRRSSSGGSRAATTLPRSVSWITRPSRSRSFAPSTSADLNAGLILGKGGRPKKASPPSSPDTGRIERHIVPLIGAQPGQGPDQGRRQQGLEGHHGGEDAG
jgi:hypothetical protein